MKDFWRLPIDSPERAAEIVLQSSLYAPGDLFKKIRPGHGIVLSTWDNTKSLGTVVAFGVVKAVDVSACTAEVAWATADVVHKPNPQGRQF